ncbi:MAG TPA: c-type cytochrome [Actinomycetota bacterium]|nr:c-type cytochrome [Actinomycetota bacterium]
MKRGLWVLALLLFAACDYGSSEGPYRPSVVAAAGSEASGRSLYLRDCAWCHGAGGQGTERGSSLVSGTQGPASVDFVLSTGRMPLHSPSDPLVRREPKYSAPEIEAIVDYIETFEPPGPDVPDVDPALGELGEGLELYAENCASCHGTTLIGGAISSLTSEGSTAVNAPSLYPSTPTEIAEAMLVGPGTMPVFGEETFSDHEVDSIVRYVMVLQDPEDRGGTPTGRIGPVTEGAIGWIVGLGLLLCVARWIGTRTGDK